MKQVVRPEEMQSKDKAVKQESYKSERSPSEVKKTDFTGRGGSGRNDDENKALWGSSRKAPRSAERVGFKPKDRMIKSYSKLSGDLELSDDAISLSDEELTTGTSVEKKRKKTSEKR